MVVDIFHETHFDQRLVVDVKAVSGLEWAHEELSKQPEKSHPRLVVDVLDENVGVQRENAWHAPFQKYDQGVVVFLLPGVVVLDPARVLEKGYTRADQDDEVVFILFRWQHALVKEQGDFGHRVNADKKVRPAILLVDFNRIENARVAVLVCIQQQDSLHLQPRPTVAQTYFVLHLFNKHVNIQYSSVIPQYRLVATLRVLAFAGGNLRAALCVCVCVFVCV